MLRITQQDNAHGAKRYYATADYYTEGKEIVGAWGGRGAAMLGLKGEVDKASFDLLCDNRDPRDGKPLTVRTRSDRTVGYDFTWSVPKSLSLLYALSGDQQILGAFRSAVDETMRDMEAEMKTRVRQSGKDEDRVTGNMVWAEFIHTTSRPVDGVPDPQLHAHCFVFNSSFDDQEHRWKAGQFRDLKRDAPFFQAAMRVRLANKVQDLGFAIDRKRDDFEIAGMSSPALLKRFSKRTELIEEIAAERGITDAKRKAELGQETREKKNEEMSWQQLRREWVGRLTEQERQAVTAVYRREKRHARPERREGQAVDYAIGHAFARKPVAAVRELETEAMKRGLGAVTVERVRRELAGRKLIRSEKDGRSLATTDAVLAEERRIVAYARKGRGKHRPLGDSGRPLSRDKLNPGQVAAVKHVLGCRDSVAIIRGAAGTGKTELMREAVEQIEANGKKVVVLAPSVGASFDVLRGEGFAKADTVARFLKDQKMQQQANGQVIWVDEAGLLGTQDMDRLFDTAGRLQARVVLSGDRKQHRAVARGEPLKLLETKAGLPVAELTQIHRQSGDYQKAVKSLSDGKIADGFAQLDRLGWIREVADAERYQQLAGAYLAAIKEKNRDGKPATALVVSPTHLEANKVTSSIRAALREEGKLDEERSFAAWVPAYLTEAQKSDPTAVDAGDLLVFHKNAPGHKNGSRLVVGEGTPLPTAYPDRFEVHRPVQLTLAVGDRVRATANFKSKDGKHRISNGSLMTVKGYTPGGDIIEDHGWVIGKNGGVHLSLGYAVTSHASQGKTVDKVFISQSSSSFPASNRRQFYVSVSRGRKQAVLFTDDRQELFKAVQRADEPMSAMDLEEARKRQKPTLRQRLGKHFAYVRRLAEFARTHEPRPAELERKPSLDREPGYAR